MTYPFRVVVFALDVSAVQILAVQAAHGEGEGQEDDIEEREQGVRDAVLEEIHDEDLCPFGRRVSWCC